MPSEPTPTTEAKMDATEFLTERGWATWYNPAYWVHPDTVTCQRCRDYTNWGVPMERAVEMERKGARGRVEAGCICPAPQCVECGGCGRVPTSVIVTGWEPDDMPCRSCGGAAPSAPTTDAPTVMATVDAHMLHGLERCVGAAHRLLDVYHDATVADRQDAEDAARLLAVLRGGATAPTPDPTKDAALLTEVATVRRLAQSRGYEGLYDLLGRIDRRLRQDTGGAYGE
jgi:hypothetical protein